MSRRPRNKPHTRETLEQEFRDQADLVGLETEVFSDGPIDAEVVFVGEGPGESEIRDRSRRPFVGGAGQMLWRVTGKFHIGRHNSYCTNVVKRQISLSRRTNERHEVHQDELDQWTALLQWELEQLPKVRIVVCLGSMALEAMTGETGILNWRGSVVESVLPNGKEGWIVCTINPAYAMHGRDPRFEPIFMADLHKLDMVIRNVYKMHYIEEIINPTYKEVLAFTRDLQKSTKPVSFDIEAINGYTACYGLSNDPHKAMCISLRDTIRNRFTVSQEADILCALQSLFDSHNIIAQNGGFDSYWTGMRERLKVRLWFDTLLAHHTLLPRLPHSLAFLVSCYTTHPFYKDDAKTWKEGGDIDAYWQYNCKDAALTYAVHERLARELKTSGMHDFFFDHVMRAQPHLVEATIHGVKSDEVVKQRVIKECEQDVKAFENEFYRVVHELTGDEEYYPLPSSWQQLQVFFFDILKLRGRGRSTNEENRNIILKEPTTPPLAREMIVALNKFKEEHKFFSTYAKSRVSSDGRFRCDYKQYGVAKAPGRLSSTKLLDGDGGNMQNQPVRARVQYVADDGCVLVYFDLSQAEAQVVSFRADIQTWKVQYAQAKIDGMYDSHRALASEMFKVPYDQVPKADWDEDDKPTIRYIAKRCRHGLNYRMQMEKLAEVTGLPYFQAQRSFIIYHQITPEIKRWWAQEEREFRATKSISNAFGRRLKVVQQLDDSVLESIIAFYSQSTIGDKVTRSWYQSMEDDNWPKGKARVAIDVHDNLVAISVPRFAKTVGAILKKYAEEPIWIQDAWKRRPAEPLSIPAELKISVPTIWNEKATVDWSGKKVKSPGTFVLDQKKGLHRWAHMVKMEL